MKKNKFLILVLSLVLLTTWSCSDFDQLKENMNVPNSVAPSLILNSVLNKLHEAPASMAERRSQYFCINYEYYGNNKYDFGAGENMYLTLANVILMESEALKLGLPQKNVYSAIAKFLKAYYFTKMSLQMGDIPMSDALNNCDSITPVYDSQKEVFKASLNLLDSCNADLTSLIGSTTGGTLQGDIYYNGDLKLWQKAVNTFTLRILMELSKKESDADLKIKTRFSDIVSNPTKYPIMTSTGDNLQYVHLYPTNIYPNNPGNFGFDALRYNCSDTYVSILTSQRDPRVYVTCEPATSLIPTDGKDTLFSVFQGANPGEDLGIMYDKTTNGKYSLLNRYRYYRTYTCEPSLELSYQEMCFIIAEGINRKWVESGALGNAEAYYTAGIKASFAYYGIPETGNMTAYFFKNGASISGEIKDAYNARIIPVDWTKYYAHDSIKYAGNDAKGLRQILKQKYVALFRHAGYESYFNYRRTGVPTFGVGPGTGNSTKIPLRFKYIALESTVNKFNYNIAIKKYGNNDDINGKMWILE